MGREELDIKLTIRINNWKPEETKNKILEFLKELDIIKFEMEEK